MTGIFRKTGVYYLVIFLLFCLIWCEQVISNKMSSARNINNRNQESEDLTNKIDGRLFNDPSGRLSFNGMYFDPNIEDYEYPELLMYDELMQIDEWLLSLRFDLEDTNVQNRQAMPQTPAL